MSGFWRCLEWLLTCCRAYGDDVSIGYSHDEYRLGTMREAYIDDVHIGYVA